MALVDATRLSDGNGKPVALQAYVLGKMGRSAEARALIGLLEDAAHERFMPPYHLALAHAGRGGREAVFAWLDRGFERVAQAAKLRYVYPLDKSMREKLEGLASPYPKRGRSDTSDTPGFQPGKGGAAPTRPLQPTTSDGQEDHQGKIGRPPIDDGL